MINYSEQQIRDLWKKDFGTDPTVVRSVCGWEIVPHSVYGTLLLRLENSPLYDGMVTAEIPEA